MGAAAGFEDIDTGLLLMLTGTGGLLLMLTGTGGLLLIDTGLLLIDTGLDDSETTEWKGAKNERMK